MKLKVVSATLVALGMAVPAVQAETWVCTRPGQADLYSDHGGPGCRKLEAVEPQSTRPSSPSSSPSVADPAPALMPTPGVSQSTKPFSEVTLHVPIVAVSRATIQPPTSTIQIHVPNPWIGLVTRLTVSHLAAGNGPEIMADSNMGDVAVRSLETAVAAAASAVGYDPRFLKVRLLIPTGINGPSAGGMFTVGIVAALLGDQIRPDVCMSGAIEKKTLAIRPVGRLEDKISACQNLKKSEMVIPFGLVTMDLALKGMSKEIKLIEVGTLADAYLAVTGQVLRRLPPD